MPTRSVTRLLPMPATRTSGAATEPPASTSPRPWTGTISIPRSSASTSGCLPGASATRGLLVASRRLDPFDTLCGFVEDVDDLVEQRLVPAVVGDAVLQRVGKVLNGPPDRRPGMVGALRREIGEALYQFLDLRALLFKM